MAAPLKDFRGKITAETDCVLEAMNRVSGKDRSELVRDILHDWAAERLREHSILNRLLKAEGLTGEDEGTTGNRRERQGKAVTSADVISHFTACKALADRCDPLSPEELAEFKSDVARQQARDGARRSGQSPQAPLPLDEAA